MKEQVLKPEYLSKVVDSYRDAVQGFARDASIVVGLLLLITAFVFFPFLRSGEEKERLTAEIGQVQAKRDRARALGEALTNLQTQMRQARTTVAVSAEQAADLLSQRLTNFAKSVKLLRGSSQVDVRTIALRRTGVEQFSPPSAGTVQGDPRIVLQQDYGLSDGQMATLATTNLSEGAINEVLNVANFVFHREIDNSYERLNAAIRSQIAQLNQSNRSVLATLRKRGSEFDIALPEDRQIEVTFLSIVRTNDYSMFQRVSEKHRILGADVRNMQNIIDSAASSVEKADIELVASEEVLNQSLEQLNQSRKEDDESIKTLESHVDDAKKELAQVAVPFSWMPMDVRTFVRTFPVLCTLALFILAIRFTRLTKLRSRLTQELSQARIEEDDIELALCVPDITLGFLAPLARESGRRLQALAVLVPLLILGFMGLLLLRVQFSPLFWSHALFWTQLPVAALGIVTAAMVYRGFRRTVSEAK